MPRAGWLALGSVAAALTTSVGPGLAGLPMAAIALTLALLARRPSRRPARPDTPGREWRRPQVAALLLAYGVVLVRATVVGAAPPAILPDGQGPWTATVTSLSSTRDGTQPATLRLLPDGPDIAASLPRYPEVEPGDVVTVAGGLRPPSDDAYGAYLRRIGVSGTLLSRRLDVVRHGTDPGAVLEHLRRASGDALAVALPEPEAGLGAGILIGLRDRVQRDVASEFTAAGVSHVVAISGWNIAIVAATIAALFGRLGRRRRTVVTSVAIVAYVLFAGASPSVVRAAAMAGVVLLARESGRGTHASAALGWAVTLLLLVEPSLVADAGFQLSSLATAGLLAWATPVTKRIGGLASGRVPAWLAESLGVSLAAQAATLPVILVAFGRLSLVSPVVNVLVAPIVAPAMAAGVVALIAGGVASLGVPSVVVAILAFPGWLGLAVMVAIVHAAAGLPFASVTVDPTVAVVLAAATVVGIVAVPPAVRRARRAVASRPAATRPGSRRRPSRRPVRRRSTTAALGAILLAAASVAVVAARRPPDVPRVTVLDVGQGDAILVEGSHGGRLLVDGGPDPDRLLTVLDERIPPWDRRIDVVVLSHPHEDHVAGLPLLVGRYRIGAVYDPGMRGPGPGYTAWAKVTVPSLQPERLLAGDSVRVDDLSMRVLWPRRGEVPLEPPDTGTGINNVSIVLLGAVAGHRFLLAGDVEEAIDPELLATGLPRLDFLKVAHHGSRTSSTEAFLDAVRPKVAAVSAGAGNPYGHPAPATIARLRAHGAAVYRTDTDGSIEVAFPDGPITVRTSGRRLALAPGAPSGGRAPVTAQTVGWTAPTALFACAIPVAAADRAATPRSGTSSRVPAAYATAKSVLVSGPRQGASFTAEPLLYHPADDRSGAGGGRRPVALARPAAMVRAAFPGRRRGRRVARGPDRRPRRRDRPPPRRGSRPPP